MCSHQKKRPTCPHSYCSHKNTKLILRWYICKGPVPDICKDCAYHFSVSQLGRTFIFYFFFIQRSLFTCLPHHLAHIFISLAQLCASLRSEGRHLMETYPLEFLSHDVWLLPQLLSKNFSDGGRLRHSTKKYSRILSGVI